LIQELLTRNPILLAFDIIALVAAVGCVVVLAREVMLYRGYRHMKGVARGIVRATQGKIFRDGSDLVINGFFRGIPTVVRFSVSDHSPDVHLWMRVSSQFNFYVFHNSVQRLEGRFRVPTADTWFDQRFTLRSDNKDAMVAFLADRRAVEELKELTCSPSTSIALDSKSLELSEEQTPPNTLKHLLKHLDTLGNIANRVGALSQTKKAKIYLPDRYVLARVALALLVTGGLIEVGIAARAYRTESASANTGNAAAAVLVSSDDELQMPSISEWRLATEADYDPETVAWFREHGHEVAGRFDGGFGLPTDEPTTAYVFVRMKDGPKGPWRVAVFSKHHTLVDVSFQQVVMAVRVPHPVLRGTDWQPPDWPVGAPDGDGLMIVRRVNDAKTATVFTLSDGKMQFQVPGSVWGLGIGAK
jgi:hypothetical protein